LEILINIPQDIALDKKRFKAVQQGILKQYPGDHMKKGFHSKFKMQHLVIENNSYSDNKTFVKEILTILKSKSLVIQY